MKIHTKILIFVIVICLFSIISISIVSFVTIKRISNLSLENNQIVSRNTEENTSDAMLSMTQYFLQLIANEQSNSCNSVLDSVKSDVHLMAGAIRNILSRPEYYAKSRPIINQGEKMPGIYSNAWLLPEYEEMTPEIEKEIALMSNLEIIMPTMTLNPYIIEFYAGLTSGLLYAYTPLRFENSQYDPRKMPWYTKALANPGAVIFTDAYEDEFGKGMIITCASTVYDYDGDLLGVAAVDIRLTAFTDMILRTSIMETGYAFILDSTGRYVAHPDMGKDGFQEYPLGALNTGEAVPFENGYRRMMQREEGFISEEINGEVFYLTYSHISAANWSIGFIVPEKEILSSLKILTAQINALMAESERDIVNMTDNAILVFASLIGVIAIMIIALSVSLSHIISNPIKELTAEIAKVGERNLTYKIAVKSNDEIGILTDAFNHLTDRLQQYMQNVLELNNINLKLQNDAYVDCLTGLFNRRYFIELVQIQLDKVSITNSSAYIVMFDVDFFKKVNDTYGHATGDKVLIGIVLRVKEMVRATDLFARYGGEEFILLFTDITRDTVYYLVERIRGRIAEAPIEVDGTSIHISASFGIAPVALQNDLDTAIKLADEALYKAKNTGRNKVMFYE